MTLPAILTLLVVAIAGIIIGFCNFQKQTTLPQDTNPSAVGVELNQTLDYVDLHKLEDNGVSFVYLKATQGRSYFDDDFLSYRDQILGTKLAYGCIVTYSNESTSKQQYDYFENKVGKNTGSLPILVEPVTSNLTKKYLQSMSNFVKLLQKANKQVMVEVDHKYYKQFPTRTLYMATGKNNPDEMKYSFWKYTTDGHVKDVDGLSDNIVMFTYNGTAQQYKERYGQLTQ